MVTLFTEMGQKALAPSNYQLGPFSKWMANRHIVQNQGVHQVTLDVHESESGDNKLQDLINL